VTTDRVIVCGGGIAGLSAATVLAERGVPVLLLEKEAYLGGRAGSWDDRLADGTAFQMERGFHAFFRQYHNLRAILRRVDPELRSLAPMADYPLLGPNGAMESFSGLPRTTPLNLIELVRRTPTLGARDLLGVDVSRAVEMLAFDPVGTYARWDGTTAKAYLDSLRFPPAARQMLFDVFAHSFFNPEEQYSAAELLAMFHYYFLGNPDGLIFDVMRAPFGEVFFEPLGTHMERFGGVIRRGVSVERIERSTGRVRVIANGEAHEGAAVVLALSVPALREVVSRSTGLPERLTTQVGSLDTTWPFAVRRLFLDRPALPGRPPFAGTTGLGPPGREILDNISIYEKLETESHRWAQRTGGSVIELHAYAVDPSWSEREVREALIEGLYQAYPETREARIVDERFLLRRDCPSFAPHSHALRPRPVTDAAEVLLAGDFVRLPFPSALMERAATSGILAANELLRARGHAGERVRTSPKRGALAFGALTL
jgi:isorenieratene synthase